jgi:hypothetical protein
MTNHTIIDIHDNNNNNVCSSSHCKKVLLELITESQNMETKMLKASKTYYYISYLIFFPSMFLNTFIGSLMLVISEPQWSLSKDKDCTGEAPSLAPSAASTLSMSKEIKGRLQYFLASLAFVNAVLMGIQKTIRPAEKAELFQVAGRRWGAFLRKLVAYKHTIRYRAVIDRHHQSCHGRQPVVPNLNAKVNHLVASFSVLVENTPMLPHWLLKKTRID